MEEFVYKITFKLFYNQSPKKSLLNWLFCLLFCFISLQSVTAYRLIP
jgi:hypothetical protein